MSYELTEKETVMVADAEKPLSRKALESKCYSLEESKRMLLKKRIQKCHN